MAKSFNSLAKNATVTIKKLVILDFVMKEVSSFTTPAWHHFLSQLDRFEMTIPGSNNREVWEIVHYEGYQELAAKFDQLFFDYLKVARPFSLHPHAMGALGPVAPLALRSEHLLHIRHIELTNMFISQNLVDIFVERAPEIETIIMCNVLASTDYPSGWRPHPTWPGNITWATLLNALSDVRPRRLSKLDVRPLKWPDGWDGIFEGARGGDYEEEIAKVKETIKQYPERMISLYRTHQEEHGFRYDGVREEGMAAHFFLGEDQRAYETLMATVRRKDPDSVCSKTMIAARLFGHLRAAKSGSCSRKNAKERAK